MNFSFATTLLALILALTSSLTDPPGEQPDQGSQANEPHTPDQRDSPKLEVVAQIQSTPGNIAISPDGRRFLSMHPFGTPRHRVIELLPDGSIRPFPTDAWSLAPDADGRIGEGIANIIGIECDREGTLWMLDAGATDPPSAPKLIAWNLKTNSLARLIHLPPPVAGPQSFMQDLAIDLTHQAVYIADMGRADLLGPSAPAIVVVDLRTGHARRRLVEHPALQPEDVRMIIDGSAVTVANGTGGTVEPRLGLNPITIDPNDEWVYFGSMHGTSIYRVRSLDLIHPALNDEQLGRLVERYGPKGVSDGISIDSAGNVYITDINNKAIGVLGSDRSYRLYIEDPLLIWPDGMSYGPDGYFYVTVNQLHRHAILNGGKNETRPPFLIVRFKPLAPSAVGR